MHKRYGFDRQYLRTLLNQTKFQRGVLERYNGTLKHATDFSWSRYKAKILIPESIALGKAFMNRYSHSLALASKRYGVEKEIITAFIRVESKFGLFGGEYRVMDVLTTLAFHPNRKERFFRFQLAKALLLARREQIDPMTLRGSFAGAMGCVQQMPSIYLKYGVDLDNNGKKDPNNMSDCIGSIAKFLQNNGWQNHAATLVKVAPQNKRFKSLRSSYHSYYSLKTLKAHGITAPIWWRAKGAYYIRLFDGKKFDNYLGSSNYHVITRYNASKQYATAIALYAKALRR